MISAEDDSEVTIKIPKQKQEFFKAKELSERLGEHFSPHLIEGITLGKEGITLRMNQQNANDPIYFHPKKELDEAINNH